MAGTDSTTKTIVLEKEQELLLNVCEPGDTFTIQLIKGSAEIFGSELQIKKEYEFSYFSSVAVFTWHGCTLQLRKQASNNSSYRIKSSRQIPKMRDLHEHLAEIRTNVDINSTNCPIKLVVGPMDVGKSTLCRFLLNYAARQGKTPIFVDLDVGQSSLSITGTVGVLSVHGPSDVYGKFNEKSLSVYYFGYKSPGHNMILYKRLVEKIGKALKTRLRKQHQRRISEVLIDTCGWIDKGGYNLITYIADMLDVNTVLVLSESSLYSRLKKDLSRRTEIIYVDKFRDVACRNQNVRRQNRDTCVSEYFYGSSSQRLHTIKVNFSDLQIFKANFDKTFGTENVVSVLIEPNILHQVFGLSYAEHAENIPLTSIYGFITIVELDMDSKVVTILSPRPGPLPTKYLLMGDITLNQQK